MAHVLVALGDPPGPIPVGYRFLAQSTSDATNQIPVEGAPDAEKDYRKLLQELEQYLTNDGQSHDLPPLFAKVRKPKAISLIPHL